jgi:FixJ family two-component response regulator
MHALIVGSPFVAAGAATAAPPETLVSIVDDDRATRHGTARLLETNGFAVATYSSPTALLADLDSRAPSCVVADLAMPDIPGLELLRKLAARGRDYPVVFVTTQPDVRASVLAMRHGAVDLLVEPFEPCELLDAVRRAVARGRASMLASRQRSLFEQQLASLTRR